MYSSRRHPFNSEELVVTHFTLSQIYSTRHCCPMSRWAGFFTCVQSDLQSSKHSPTDLFDLFYPFDFCIHGSDNIKGSSILCNQPPSRLAIDIAEQFAWHNLFGTTFVVVDDIAEIAGSTPALYLWANIDNGPLHSPHDPKK